VNWSSWLVWGFVGTSVLTTVMSGGQGLGLTRMNMPFILGTIFTPSRDRAQVYGVLVHLFNGWIFSLAYVAAFHATHLFTWWFGAAIGVVQGAFVLAVAMPVFPGMHPRMASEIHGPTVVAKLEPPGFLGQNYGARTPIAVLLAHAVFGALLGLGYSPY
jgi:hypothetical protein